MAEFTDVILKASPDGMAFVGRIARYSAGHRRNNAAVHSTRNDPIEWPIVDGVKAEEAIWENAAIRAATVEEVDALRVLEAQVAADRKEIADNLRAAVDGGMPIFKALAKAINKLRVQAGGQAYSVDEWKVKLKAEM